jgi:hypothetical protein
MSSAIEVEVQNSTDNTQTTHIWNNTGLEGLDDVQGFDEAGTKQKHLLNIIVCKA